MTPIVFIISITSITGPRMLAAMNKEKLALISYIIGATANIICNLILIPIYGALGAALGTLVAETFVTTIQVIFLHQYIFSKDNFISLIHSTFATILMGILIIFILKYVNNSVSYSWSKSTSEKLFAFSSPSYTLSTTGHFSLINLITSSSPSVNFSKSSL